MEVQMAAQGRKPTGHGGGAMAKPVPGYLRPSAASCHHVCKYGGTHTFEDHKEAHKAQPRPPRKQPPPPAPAPAKSHHNHNRVLVKVRSVFRRRVADSTTTTTAQKPSKAAAGKAKAAKVGESVEWKDIVAYDTVPLPPHGSSKGLELDKTSAEVTGSGGDAKKKDVMKKGKKSDGKAKIHEQVENVEGGQNEPLDTKASNDDSDRSARPPKAKNKPAALVLVENMGIDRETLQGYQILSPSLAQSRANLLRDLEKEMMVEEPADVKEEWATVTYSLNPEEYAAAESSRPIIPAHRRVQSMSMGGISSRSVRHPFARQVSRNSGAFKVRSRSTRAPAVLPPEEEKPARLRSRRGGEQDGSSGTSTGRGIHLRIRSLRRRGVGGSGGAGTGGFVVPAVALRHQKTLEKKKSQRLYNNLIEETATKLVKTRKSRVKALVGAFESVISKIAK